MKVKLFLVAVSLFVIAVSALVVVTVWNRASTPTAQLAAGSAATSSVINYQGVLNNASGAPVTGNYSMTFSLYRTPITTTALWSEVQLSVTVGNGLFSVYLGDYNPIPPSIFNRENLYLGVAVAGDSEMTPRTRLAMVPYAYTANQVACLSGQTICNSACTDLASDPAHCGSCASACKTGALCTSGTCICPNGQVTCPTACSDLTTDPNNCGTCGVKCAIGGSCTNGQCTCPIGDSLCSGVCANTSTDPNNCGGCGVKCGANQTCTAGTCH